MLKESFWAETCKAQQQLKPSEKQPSGKALKWQDWTRFTEKQNKTKARGILKFTLLVYVF